jgi:hypothetical protein
MLTPREGGFVEHSKVMFTLTLKVRCNQHIIATFKGLAPVPRPTPPPVLSAPSKGDDIQGAGNPPQYRLEAQVLFRVPHKKTLH